MSLQHLSDPEVAKELATKMRAWRVSERGAGLTQAEVAARAGIGVTPLKRFEATGGSTLLNFIATLRALGLLDQLENLIPDPARPTPMELLKDGRQTTARKRAPRRSR